MNISENKDLKGQIAIQDQNKGYIPPYETAQTYSFQDEFEKLKEIVDPSQFLVQAPLSPLLEFNINEIEDIEYEDFNIDTKEIENKDAMFFLNISNNSNQNNLRLKDGINISDASNYKTMEVSKTLSDLLIKSQENNKALRLDFDNQVTVVLKVSKEGRIDATFFPRDKEVENYLKNNIDYLKVRFDEQNIAYSNISYKPYKQNQQNRQQQNKGDK